jgi:hypothetical protein
VKRKQERREIKAKMWNVPRWLCTSFYSETKAVYLKQKQKRREIKKRNGGMFPGGGVPPAGEWQEGDEPSQ